MDIAPKKNNLASTFEVKIDGIKYAELVIPGNTDTSLTHNCTLVMYNGATSNYGTTINNNIVTGTNTADVQWTTGWELTINLPAITVGKRIPLSLNHQTSGAAASDVVIDSLTVHGGECGTGLACICQKANPTLNTRVGDNTNNNGNGMARRSPLKPHPLAPFFTQTADNIMDGSCSFAKSSIFSRNVSKNVRIKL